MDTLTLLIFDLDGARFGLDATQVRESVWLPELTLVEEAPPCVVGLFSLRGRIIPVIDLHLRFGHQARQYTRSDQVVVLEVGNRPMGLIVGEIREVIDLPYTAIQKPPQFDAEASGPDHMVTGEVRVGDDLVTLLDVSRLVHLNHLPEEPVLAEAEQLLSTGRFCPAATPEERALFHARALALREVANEEEGSHLGLAVVELDGEYFGIELAAVQEFCNIVQLSPIPCCPPHILGAISLRGEMLTLIDPRSALNLPPATMGGKAVIARLGERAVGLAVDDVHDVDYLRQDKLQPPPAALLEQCGTEISGTTSYAGRVMTVLDLPALLAREEWTVNESV